MAKKITGYKIYKSSGGNTCIQCDTRMSKGLPYMSPVTGKRKIKKLTGKSICITCIKDIYNIAIDKVSDKKKAVERYQTRRFLEHLD